MMGEKENDLLSISPEEFDLEMISPEEFDMPQEPEKGTLGQGIKAGAKMLNAGANIYTGSLINKATGEDKRERLYGVWDELKDPQARSQAAETARQKLSDIESTNKDFIEKYAFLKSKYEKIFPSDKENEVVDRLQPGASKYMALGQVVAGKHKFPAEEEKFLKENREKYESLTKETEGLRSYIEDIEEVNARAAEKGEEAAGSYYKKAADNETLGERMVAKGERKMGEIPEKKGFAYNAGVMIPQGLGIAAAITSGIFTAGKSPLVQMIPKMIAVGSTGYLTAGAGGMAMNDYKEYAEPKGEYDPDTALKIGTASAAIEMVSEWIPYTKIVPKHIMGKMSAQAFVKNPKLAIDFVDQWAKKFPKKYADYVRVVSGMNAKGMVEGASEAVAEMGYIMMEDLYKDPDDRPKLNEMFNRTAQSFVAGYAFGIFFEPLAAGAKYRENYLRRKENGITLVSTKDSPDQIYELIGSRKDGSAIVMDNKGEEKVIDLGNIDQNISLNNKQLNEYLDAMGNSGEDIQKVKRNIIAENYRQQLNAEAGRYRGDDGNLTQAFRNSDTNKENELFIIGSLDSENYIVEDPSKPPEASRYSIPKLVVSINEIERYDDFVSRTVDAQVEEYFASEPAPEIDADVVDFKAGDEYNFNGTKVKVTKVAPNGNVTISNPELGEGVTTTLTPEEAINLTPVVESGTQQDQSLLMPELLDEKGKAVGLEQLEDGTTILSKSFKDEKQAQTEADRLNKLYPDYSFSWQHHVPERGEGQPARPIREVIVVSQKDKSSQSEQSPTYRFDGAEITKAQAKAKVLRAKSIDDISKLEISSDPELQAVIDKKFPQVPASYKFQDEDIDKETALALIEEAQSPEELNDLQVTGDKEIEEAIKTRFSPKVEDTQSGIKEPETGENIPDQDQKKVVSLQDANTQDNEQSDNNKDRGRNPVSGKERPDQHRAGIKGADDGIRYDAARSDSRIRRATVKEHTFTEDDVREIRKIGDDQIIDDYISEINDPALFHEFITASKENNRYGASVVVYPIEEYAKMRLFVTKDGKAGGALKPDGELVSAFSFGEGKGRLMQIQYLRIKEGGTMNDCFNTVLPIYYAKNGFEPVAKVRWSDDSAPADWDKTVYEKYNGGEPDVILMVYTGNRHENVTYLIDALPYSDTYEDAKKVQLARVEEVKKSKAHDKSVTGEATYQFFTDVSKGLRDKSNVPYKPVLKLTESQDKTNQTIASHRGNFDDHIAKSIPGHKEIQAATAQAVIDALPQGGKVLDIGGSENAWGKAISQLTDGKIETVVVDPNDAMKEHSDKTPVKGNEYVSAPYMTGWENTPAWDSNDKFDAVHESMTFQFIDNKREAQIDFIIENNLSENGVLMLEEKFSPENKADKRNPDSQWRKNEEKKDEYKRQYFNDSELTKKKTEVVEGMHDGQISTKALEDILTKRFVYVGRYWNSGNFSGYIATNDKAKFDAAMNSIGTTGQSEFTVDPIGALTGTVNKTAAPKQTTSTKEKRRTRIAEKKSAKQKANQPVQEKIEQAGEQTDVNPTDAQKSSGKYQKGEVTIQGYTIAIENPKGSIRSGKDSSGREWSTEMKNDYGEIQGITGADGDKLDAFIGKDPSSKLIFVVDQMNDAGRFDEHKVMFGFQSASAAERAYLDNYEYGWNKAAAITEFTKEEFDEWIQKRDRNKGKPANKHFSQSKAAITNSLTEFNKKTGTIIKTEIVQKRDELPPEVAKENFEGGIYYDDTVYFVVDEIPNTHEAAKIWMHEIGVHAGLRKLFNGRANYREQMRDVYDSVRHTEQMKKIRAEYPDYDQIALADEYLAYLGETFLSGQDAFSALDKVEATTWNRFANWFRSVARTIIPNLSLSDTEIAGIIVDSYRAARGEKPKFTRARRASTVSELFDSDEIRIPTIRARREIAANPKFREWFGDSRIKDNNNLPRVMFHGTTGDFDEFVGDGRPIFISPKPEFAEVFAGTGGVKTKIDKESGNIEYDFKSYADDPNVTKRSRANIMPLYVRAERPWDYENADDVQALVNHVYSRGGDMYSQNDIEMFDNLSSGSWATIEIYSDLIRELGYDGFHVKEYGVKNLAVFNGNQIKSATGNSGEFSLAETNIRSRRSNSVGAVTDTELQQSKAAWMKQGLKSPYFKAWFGDWEDKNKDGVSKITDEDGIPMRVYPVKGDITANLEDPNSNILVTGVKNEDSDAADYYANTKNPFDFDSDAAISELAEYISQDSERLAQFNRVTGEYLDSIEGETEPIGQAFSQEDVEDALQVMADGDRKKSLPYISDIIRNSGRFDGMILDNSPENFSAVVFDQSQLAESAATEASTQYYSPEVLNKAADNGVPSPLGLPTTINDPDISRARRVSVSDNYKLSYVKESDLIDIKSLIKEVSEKKQKVWFWTADQLGRGEYYDTVIGDTHFLDAGISYALDEKHRKENRAWASSLPPKTLNNLLQNSDYIFIVSGSPTSSHAFNKRVFELFRKRVETVGDYKQFKRAVLKASNVTPINDILERHDSFDSLAESPDRKELLNQIYDQQKRKTDTPLKKALSKYNALFDPHELRDDFLRENGFDKGDIMLVLKPIAIAENSADHSTYLHEIYGDVIGVPDHIVNSFDLLPKEFDKKLSANQKLRAVTGYSGAKVHEITSEKLEDVRARRSLRDLNKPEELALPDGTKIPKMLTKTDKLRELVQDRMLSVRNIQDEVIRRGGRIDESSNTYEEENRADSMTRRATTDFDQDVFDPMIEFAASLTTKYNGLTFDNVQMYLKAKHAIERNAQMFKRTKRDVNSGIPTDKAKIIVEQFEREVDAADVATLWRHVHKATDFILNRYLNDGFISRNGYDIIKKTYNFYVPLRGWKVKERPESVFDYLDDADRVSYSPIRKAEGRVTESENPLEYIQAMAHSAIASGNKNSIKQNAARMVFNNKGMDDLFYMKKYWKVKTGLIDPVTGNEIEEEYDQKPDDALFKAGKVRYDYIRSQHKAYRTSEMSSQHEVDVFIEGEKYTMVFQDPAVANAIDRRNVWNPPIAEGLQKSVGVMTRLMSSLATSKNPAFIPINLIRDVSYAMTSLSMQDDLSAARTLKNMGKAMGSIKRHLYSRNKDFDPVNNQTDKHYNDFLKNGGETGFVHLKDITRLQKQLVAKAELLKRKASGGTVPMDVLKSIWNVVNEQLDNFATLSENATRFAVYLTAIEQGKSINEAVKAAKNITVNFNRKGRIATAAGSLYAFFNAAIQGGQNFARLGKRHSKKFLIGSAMFAAMGYLISKLNADWDDDNDDEYGESNYRLLSDYVKHTNIVIPATKKGKFITIPLPHGFRAIYSLGVLAHQLEKGEKDFGQAVGSFASNVMESVSPINAMAFYNKEQDKWTARPAVPTPLQPIWDIAFNEDYLGNTVYNEPFMKTWDGLVADSKLGKSTVSKPIESLTNFLYDLGSKGNTTKSKYYFEDGKVKKVPEIFDWNPSKVEHIFEGYLGGVGRFATDIIKTSTGIIEAAHTVVTEDKAMKDAISESMNVNFLPVVRRLYQSPWGDSAVKKYYVIRDEVETYDFMVNQAKKELDVDLMESLMNDEELKTKSMIFNATKKSMDKIINSVYTSGDKNEIDQGLKDREELIQYTIEEIEKATGKKIKF